MSSIASPSLTLPKTFGDLKASGYVSRPVKSEIRENLIASLHKGENIFEGIYGYEDTVIPEMQRAILSRHHILLLGLRGQAKTRIARMMIRLLDPWLPAVSGSEMQDDPFNPISPYAKEMLFDMGEDTPLEWIAAHDRYVEKLATPDVSVADLIGDADPIKAANLKLSYSDERILHLGLIPRAHRSIFVINELPDLQPRIQVALFNILQEGDIQIRGFRIRMPLDIQFVFTANPEDYTQRGSIVTPLKDRIDSQIITHYPKRIEDSKKITLQEAHPAPAQQANINCPDLIHTLIEQIAIEARKSDLVDPKSGVSARMTIAAYENLLSTAELRMLQNGETSTQARISDIWGILPGITGKVELVYEGEQEGAAKVARNLIGKAIRQLFTAYFPDPGLQKKKKKNPSLYQPLLDWFGKGNQVEMGLNLNHHDYLKTLQQVPGLQAWVEQYIPNLPEALVPLMMEFLLHGLAEFSLIRRDEMSGGGLTFTDMLNSMFGNMDLDLDSLEQEYGDDPDYNQP
jgi:magnesium chelatase subunit I